MRRTIQKDCYPKNSKKKKKFLKVYEEFGTTKEAFRHACEILIFLRRNAKFEKYTDNLPIISLFIASRSTDKIIPIKTMMEKAFYKSTLVNMLDIYNQCSKILPDKLLKKDRKEIHQKRLSQELVMWDSLKDHFDKQPFFIKTKQNEKFFWMLFVIIFGILEKNDFFNTKNCSILNFYKIYNNYVIFLKEKIETKEINLPFHGQFNFRDKNIIQKIESIVLTLKLKNPISLHIEENTTFLENYEKETDMLFIRTAAINPFITLGDINELKSLRFINYSMFKINKIELCLHNFGNILRNVNMEKDFRKKTKIAKLIQSKDYLSEDEKMLILNLFYKSRKMIIKRDTPMYADEKKNLYYIRKYNYGTLFYTIMTVLFTTGNLYKLQSVNILKEFGISPFEVLEVGNQFIGCCSSFFDQTVINYLSYTEYKLINSVLWRYGYFKTDFKLYDIFVKEKIFLYLYQRIFEVCELTDFLIDRNEYIEMFKVSKIILENKDLIGLVCNRGLITIAICSIFICLRKKRLEFPFWDFVSAYKILCFDKLKLTQNDYLEFIFKVPTFRKNSLSSDRKLWKRDTEYNENIVSFYKTTFFHFVRDNIKDISDCLSFDILKLLSNVKRKILIFIAPYKRKRSFITKKVVTDIIVKTDKIPDFEFKNKKKDENTPLQPQRKFRKFK